MEAKQRKGAIAVAVLIFGGIGAAAVWTTNVGKALPTWLSWLPFLPSALAFIYWIVLACCAFALFLTAYREWRERKSLHRQKILEEIESFRGLAQSISQTTRARFGPDQRVGVSLSDIIQGINMLTESLVRSSAYDGRVKLYSTINFIRYHVNREDWRGMEYHLNILDAWVDFTEQELNKGTPPQLKDPLLR